MRTEYVWYAICDSNGSDTKRKENPQIRKRNIVK